MRINNVSSSTSLQTVISLSVILSLYAVVFIGMCIFCSPAQLMQAFLGIEDLYDKFMIGLCIFVLPIVLICVLVSVIKTRNKALKTLNLGFNLKYVDFLEGRVEFCFNDPSYNFVCGYDDIEKLDMELKTIEVRTKNGVYIVLKEIKLNFGVLNGKTFFISNTPLKPINLIYKIIDYERGVKNFSYKFTGAGVSEDIKERIEDYKRLGCKQILSTEQEDKFKLMSILFFAMGMVLFCSFGGLVSDVIGKGDFGILLMLSPFSLFVVVAFVLDAFLIADKIKERKFGIKHKSKNLIGKIPCELIVAIEVIAFAVILYMLFKPLVLSMNDKKVLKVNSNVEQRYENQTSEYKNLEKEEKKKPKQTTEFEELYINPTSEYNNLRKDEIYSTRKAYVKDSLFADDNYEPNEAVFGAIEDYKPWWGTIICKPIDYKGDNHENIEGDSQQSIQINNPNILIGLKHVYIMYDRNESDFCTSEYARFIPQSLKYSKKDNLIIAEYEVSKDFLNTYVQVSGKRKRFPLQLSGLNALDFGYKYVYAYETENIKMFNSDNITENVGEFRDFIHVGSSCGYAGGCNNISPMQNDKMITVADLPAEINLKLWKKQPVNKFQKADMYYRIIFKSYN